MVKIYLSINNNEDVMLLPVTPEEYELKESWENKELKGLYTTLNVIMNKGLSTITIESFFPVRDYPFLLNRELWGREYVDKLNAWWARKMPIRLIILNDDVSVKTLTVNMAVTIESLETRVKKDGDIYYSLKLKEFKFIEVS